MDEGRQQLPSAASAAQQLYTIKYSLEFFHTFAQRHALAKVQYALAAIV